MSIRTALALVVDALDPAERDWAVVGAVALGVHGVPRATLDLDLLVDKKALPRLDNALLGAGYELTHRWEESSHFAGGGPGRCPVDVLHAHRPHSRRMLAEAEPRDVGGLTAPVVRREDLIGLKLQGMVNDPERERTDAADIRRLLEVAVVGPPLDGGRVRAYFELFGRAGLLDELAEGLERALA